ncbi:putative Rho-GTPase-activating protein 6 [Colletotrichum orbiculare MAFF 240422]|uniref:Rho-GTPase-activating protein 6 n=1 Tax=Colletotrichum orbiculare (strain 104-T / ATCC 96160 / CBS 514.97 / LARS 414 / MAFF 240422) TaxID=1213857 RepID=A0A484FL45_COLOR|nr:putative Rho-GTPase-activating protein 6 [Colletotrichum orbiculare MAFF 240422]
MDILSDTDQIQDRRAFVEEYNRLAKKLGIRVLQEFPETRAGTPIDKPEKRRWWSRIFRSPSSGPSAKARGPSGSLRHKRSVSDMALHLVHAWKPDPKTLDLQTMVRLSGKSFFYLPPEYSVEALVIPTCFRATAQHLVQYGPDTRGIFRIPGSLRIINAIFDYYCHETAGEEINSTTRCPSLPAHLNAATHDVASVFKKFISVLPGGILGSLAVYDALVAVYAQYRREPELSRTKETKARARLIALAIETVESKFRRELVCAVFGLLSVIGRAAETAARKDELGRPLPTSDLMGYTALGIIFGPLIVGDLLGSYDMKLDNPSPGPVLLPVTPPTLKLERQRNDNLEDAGLQAVNKAHVANDVTEMLITNWREIPRSVTDPGRIPTSIQGIRKFEDGRQLKQQAQGHEK